MRKSSSLHLQVGYSLVQSTPVCVLIGIRSSSCARTTSRRWLCCMATSTGFLLSYSQLLGNRKHIWSVCTTMFLLFSLLTIYRFQTYYEAELLSNKTPSDISWIGSIEGFLLLTVSVLAGPLYDRGHFRALIMCGTFLLVLGVFLLSICTQYWSIMLTQGILVGVGAGLLFLPSVAILPTYFVKRKALANGIAMSGSGLGGIIYPVIFHKLQPQIGFGWATRVIAFIMLGTLIVPIVGMKMRAKPPGVRKMIELEAWKDVPYALLGAGVFLGFAGLYVVSTSWNSLTPLQY